MDAQLFRLPGLKVAVSDIQYLDGEGNYTWFHLTKGRQKLTSRTLAHYAPLLPDFIRIHREHLINPAYALNCQRTGPKSAVMLMKDGAKLPISRRRIKEVCETLKLSDNEWLKQFL
ncbi:LytTR family DNA-binding domain-containing protein [Spirosoma areae]